jgi:hypothetical protein
VVTAKDMEQGGSSDQSVADGRYNLDTAMRLDSHGEKCRHIDSLPRSWSSGVDDSLRYGGFYKVIRATNARWHLQWWIHLFDNLSPQTAGETQHAPYLQEPKALNQHQKNYQPATQQRYSPGPGAVDPSHCPYRIKKRCCEDSDRMPYNRIPGDP